ncbi:MAG TPA: serine protease, partial [Vicinamibacterales bacterium]|nr:serine protease [Vicinamibacterales bacterium]
IWTATTHGSGFLIDSTGLIATDQQVIGAATSVEVQLSPSVKVAGSVVATDVVRGIALVRINPSIASTAKVLPLQCDQPPPPVAVGQVITALEASLLRLRGTRVGAVESVLANVIDTDLVSSASGSGGPAFDPTGRLIGLTTLVPAPDGERSNRSRVVRVSRVCEFVASAADKTRSTPPPPATQLPVESLKRFQSDPAATAAIARAGKPTVLRVASADFDIAFITPAQLIAEQATATGGAVRVPTAEVSAQPLIGFSNWAEYVEDTPAVLLIRVTPKFAEGFWRKIGRGVAMTQGVAIPSVKRPKGDFGRMRALCGDTEVVPVHPFKLEHRGSDKEVLVEGLYAFDPGALSPSCKSVTLQLFSEKEPRTPDTLVVDPKVIQQIWQDFAPLRGPGWDSSQTMRRP